MFARTERAIKQYLLEHCFIDAMVYLPTDAFYSTPVETYVLAITKKADANQAQHFPVFSFLASEIGETRDTRREPTRNDLDEMVDEFRNYTLHREKYLANNPRIKLVPIDQLDPAQRWDVDRLWTVEEKRALGVIERSQYSVDDLIMKFSDVTTSLIQSQKTLKGSKSYRGPSKMVPLSEATVFNVHRGSRVTKKECQANPGDILVIASGRHKESYFGRISEAYLKRKFGKSIPGLFTSQHNVVSVGATGSVGVVHIRDEERWFLHDDALAVEILSENIDREYLRYALQQAISEEQFAYSAKLYQERLSALSVKIPTTPTGSFDPESQRKLAEIYRQQERIRSSVFQTVQDLMACDVAY
jgi:type I restriction enzyme M protein